MARYILDRKTTPESLIAEILFLVIKGYLKIVKKKIKTRNFIFLKVKNKHLK